jgi:hypothetical protein
MRIEKIFPTGHFFTGPFASAIGGNGGNRKRKHRKDSRFFGRVRDGIFVTYKQLSTVFCVHPENTGEKRDDFIDIVNVGQKFANKYVHKCG